MNQILFRIDQRAIEIENQRAHGSQLRVSHESFILIWPSRFRRFRRDF
jgi:plasmid replication initiation protein